MSVTASQPTPCGHWEGVD